MMDTQQNSQWCIGTLIVITSGNPTKCAGNFTRSSADFFQNQFFWKILSGIQSERQTVRNQIRTLIVITSGNPTKCAGYFTWSSVDFFHNQLFWKILSGMQSECQTVRIQIRPDGLSGLIWVLSVCIDYQQTTLISKGLNKQPVNSV